MFSEPLNGDEAILKVLRAKSLFDVVDVKDKDSLDKKRLLRALTKLANMVEPANNLRQKERATQAKRSRNKFLEKRVMKSSVGGGIYYHCSHPRA